MPNHLGVNATWGRDQWAAYVLRHLSTESVLLRAGARVVPVRGRIIHIPRTLTDGTAAWTAEGAEIPSSAPTGDQLVLTPKKLANVVSLSRESIEDAPINELDAVGNALTRSVAAAIDARAFSAAVATVLEPAGLRSYAIPGLAGGVTIDNIIRAAGMVESYGAITRAAFVNPADITTLRLAKDSGGRPLLQPDLQSGGAERIAGATLFPTPALAVGNAIVGDVGQIVIGVRRDIEVAFSGDAKFTADSVAARVTARADWGINDIRGLVAITTP